MQMREGELERQAYLAQRQNDADIATREYVSKHAYELGYADGLAKGTVERIFRARRLLGEPLLPIRAFEGDRLEDLLELADWLERQLLPPNDAS